MTRIEPLFRSWPTRIEQARAVQEGLRGRVLRVNRLGRIRWIAGIDASYDRGAQMTRAAVAVLDARKLELVEWTVARRKTRFPYVPGYLAFREGPAALAALGKLRRLPDLILCDGQGYAHPRRFGLACHLGVLLDRPAIGVAKTRLIGEHAAVPERAGSWSPLIDAGELVGAALRTRAGVKPVYVSVGHRIGLRFAIRHVLESSAGFRLPEPIRHAHRLAGSDRESQRARS